MLAPQQDKVAGGLDARSDLLEQDVAEFNLVEVDPSLAAEGSSSRAKALSVDECEMK